jgi:hypothetical protein
MPIRLSVTDISAELSEPDFAEIVIVPPVCEFYNIEEPLR